MKIEFVVYGKPQGKQRPRFSRRSSSIYTPKNTEMYEAQIAKAYKSAANGFSFGDKPVEVWITAVMPKAKTSKKEYPTIKPDIDNIQKAVFELSIISCVNSSPMKPASFTMKRKCISALRSSICSTVPLRL